MAKVLVIDDDSMNVRMADFILKKGNYEVVAAMSGEEGIACIKAQAPDIVLLDIEMPDMNGIETLEKIRQTEEISQTKVLFLTATVTDQIRADADRLNVLSIVQKPFKAPELLGELEKVK